MQSTPLQIKTDSTAGSGEDINLYAYSGSGYIGFISVWVGFKYTPRFSLSGCGYGIDFTRTPPVEDNKVWTIRKTDSAVTIECNGVELVDFKFAERGGECAYSWGQQVQQIKFASSDTASDSYRAEPSNSNSDTNSDTGKINGKINGN